jgi:ABC-type lipoprotein release transport system permease subunit
LTAAHLGAGLTDAKSGTNLDILSQVLFHEALLIFLFGIAAAVVAAFFASRRATEIKPQEVIRYE